MILKYTIQVFEEGEGHVASVKELAGCITQGDSLTELFTMIQDAIESWLDTVAE